MSSIVFVTGTDTGCGKTTVSCRLACFAAAGGHRVACFKPVASGCFLTAKGMRSADALALMAVANVALDYQQVNPIALQAPIAPHIAAAHAGLDIDPSSLAGAIRSVRADLKLVEGAGGWMVPLGPRAMTADLARRLRAKVLLVVGLRLGAINHALLSARAIVADGLELGGWIANRLDPDQAVVEENIETLAGRLGPPLAELEHHGRWRNPAGLARWLTAEIGASRNDSAGQPG